MSAATILIVDDDEVLGQILTRVLTQQGYQVERATDAAQAVQLARERPPQLGLLDLCLPDQDGVALAQKLRGQAPGLPLILMTAYPLSLREHPERTESFAHVLTKPLNLQELRHAVDATLQRPTLAGAQSADLLPPARALEQDPMAEPAAAGGLAPAAGAGRDGAPESRRVGSPPRRRWLAWAGAAAVVVALLAVALLVGGHVLSQSERLPAEAPEPPRMKAGLVKGRRDTISVPDNVVRSLGVQTVVAAEATEPLPLELPGSLALDPDRLVRVHSRFPGEVVELGPTTEGRGEFATAPRPIRFGDTVTKDQLLAVLWSKDLGEKKSELIDALVQLKVDEKILTEAEKSSGAVPQVFMWNATRTVEADLNAVNRAERTLRVWRLTDQEIQELRDEAEKIRQRGGKRDTEKERNWARVEVRAPFAGAVIEKNISIGDMADTSTDLFKIANTDVVAVWANAYEEDLPSLRALPKEERRWTIRLPGDPLAAPIPGTIDKIGYVIDPNQHTALVMGRVENPGNALRAGQFITATVELPPPPQVLAVPIDALVEDGERSVVFVQPDPHKNEYAMRQVLVVQRRRELAFIRLVRPEWLLLSLPDPAAPLNGAVGTLYELPSTEPQVRVVSSGALLMKGALEDLQSGK
jgi:cobalt-zinc-cadmium efflux system membrane fusion protein